MRMGIKAWTALHVRVRSFCAVVLGQVVTGNFQSQNPLFGVQLQCFLILYLTIKIHNIIRLMHFHTFLCFCTFLLSNNIVLDPISICFVCSEQKPFRFGHQVMVNLSPQGFVRMKYTFSTASFVCSVRLQSVESNSVHVCTSGMSRCWITAPSYFFHYSTT